MSDLVAIITARLSEGRRVSDEDVGKLLARIAELEARVAEARRAALEEAIAAAHDAWQDGVPPAEIAAAISKLLMEKKDD